MPLNASTGINSMSNEDKVQIYAFKIMSEAEAIDLSHNPLIELLTSLGKEAINKTNIFYSSILFLLDSLIKPTLLRV